MGSRDEEMFRRLLCMGSDANSYRVSERNLSVDKGSIAIVTRLIADGKIEEIIKEVTRYNTEKRSMKREILFLTLAKCAKSDSLTLKQKAHGAVVNVCATPAELFLFLNFSKLLTDSTNGWGRSQRTAVSRWYNSRKPRKLVELVTRYKSRAGWSHRDVFRLGHFKADNDGIAVIFKYLVKGLEAAKSEYAENTGEDVEFVLKYLEAVEMVKHSDDGHQIARLIEEFHFCKEHIPTQAQRFPEVWSALINKMSLTEILQNVGKLASIGFLEPPTLNTFIERVQNQQALEDERVQPFVALTALQIYKHAKGKKKWIANTEVVELMSKTFDMTLKNVSSTKMRYLIAIKVGTPDRFSKHTNVLQPALASAALAMITAKTAEYCQIGSIGIRFTPLNIPTSSDIQQYYHKIKSAVTLNPYSLPCPLLWAIEKNQHYDVFIILTDVPVSNREFRDEPTLKEAIEQYRSKMNMPKAKLVICGLTGSTNFPSIDDPNILDVSGFDSSVPDVINKFVTDGF